LRLSPCFAEEAWLAQDELNSEVEDFFDLVHFDLEDMVYLENPDFVDFDHLRAILI